MVFIYFRAIKHTKGGNIFLLRELDFPKSVETKFDQPKNFSLLKGKKHK